MNNLNEKKKKNFSKNGILKFLENVNGENIFFNLV